ncbi:MAG TPA: hypothetical protein VGG64_15150, partial [Pirellulales bacterium]
RSSTAPTANHREQLQLQRKRAQLEKERASLNRWMSRLKRAFHAVEKGQLRVTRLERQIFALEHS